MFIEPRDIYDKAIIKGKRSKPVYSYYMLVILTFEEMGLDTVSDAIEWVDYNMLSVLEDDQIKYVKKHEKEIYVLTQITGEEENF
jgi:hypothetical protein